MGILLHRSIVTPQCRTYRIHRQDNAKIAADPVLAEYPAKLRPASEQQSVCAEENAGGVFVEVRFWDQTGVVPPPDPAKSTRRKYRRPTPIARIVMAPASCSTLEIMVW